MKPSAAKRRQYSLSHLFALATASAMLVFFFTLPLNWPGFFRFWGQLYRGEVLAWFRSVL